MANAELEIALGGFSDKGTHVGMIPVMEGTCEYDRATFRCRPYSLDGKAFYSFGLTGGFESGVEATNLRFFSKDGQEVSIGFVVNNSLESAQRHFPDLYAPINRYAFEAGFRPVALHVANYPFPHFSRNDKGERVGSINESDAYLIEGRTACHKRLFEERGIKAIFMSIKGLYDSLTPIIGLPSGFYEYLGGLLRRTKGKDGKQYREQLRIYAAELSELLGREISLSGEKRLDRILDREELRKVGSAVARNLAVGFLNNIFNRWQDYFVHCDETYGTRSTCDNDMCLLEGQAIAQHYAELGKMPDLSDKNELATMLNLAAQARFRLSPSQAALIIYGFQPDTKEYVHALAVQEIEQILKRFTGTGSKA